MSESVSSKPEVASIGWVHFDATRWALTQMARTDITPLAKLVLFAMAAHVRDEQYAVWPSQHRMATLVGATRHGVRLAIDSLTAAGLIVVVKADGLRAPHTYRLRCEDSLQRCKDDRETDVNRVDTKELVLGTTTKNVQRARKPSLLDGQPELLRRIWNEHRGDLPEWRVVSPQQDAEARRRLKELAIENWPDVVRIMAASPFCVDKRLGPDFLLRSRTWPRALNGEIAGWGKATIAGRVERALTPAQAVKRRIERSSTDDHLAEALAYGGGDEGGEES
jgi:hypothetical protein